MALLDLLLPPACAGCGAPGALVCRVCLARFRPPSAANARFVTAESGTVVGDALLLAVAAFAYEGPLRRALAAVKYGGAARVARQLADASRPALAELQRVSGPATLVPVPLHLERLRTRGYNQAELVSRALASRESPTRNSLRRVRPTTRQHRLDRMARLQNMRGAFESVGPVPTAVILVDDILTTAATLEACAAVLRAAGTEAVYGFAIAREV